MVSKTRDARRRTKEAAAAPVSAPITKKIGGDKNGGERVVYPKTPVYYPADDIPEPVASRKQSSRKPTKLRPSISPGTILILLAGRHRARRVVFLKQLESGLLLVTGPFKVNGVPLRRVDQAYVIATSTKVDVGRVDTSKFDDAYFAVPAKKDEEGETAEGGEEGAAPKTHVPAEGRVADQKAVDAPLLEELAKDHVLKAYLRASFSLTKGQYPHEMKF